MSHWHWDGSAGAEIPPALAWKPGALPPLDLERELQKREQRCQDRELDCTDREGRCERKEAALAEWTRILAVWTIAVVIAMVWVLAIAPARVR